MMMSEISADNKLLREKENIQDEILSCLENLNLLEHFTPDELGMTEEEIISEREKETQKIKRLNKYYHEK